MASVDTSVHVETRRLLQAEAGYKEAACGLIIAPDRRVLVLSYRNGWGIPGGKREEMDRGIKSCCAREMREELGVIVFEQQLSFLVQGLCTSDKGTRLVTVFHVGAVHGDPFPREGGDMAWFTDEYLFRSRPFGDFYALHFPDGFDHLVPTAIYT